MSTALDTALHDSAVPKSDVKGAVADRKHDRLKWMIGLWVAQFGLMSGLVFGLVTLSH